MSRPILVDLSKIESLGLRDDPEPEDIVSASADQLMSMRHDANSGNFVEFEKKFYHFEPTEQMWEMRMLLSAKAGNLDEFEKMFNTIKPTTEKMWEMRILANFNAFNDDTNPNHSRQFQKCLQVAMDMQKDEFQPTTTVIDILTKIAKSQKQKTELADAIDSWSKASNGGRPKMRRQIRTRTRHRLNKSKKIRRRKLRRTRHRNRSYS